MKHKDGHDHAPQGHGRHGEKHGTAPRKKGSMLRDAFLALVVLGLLGGGAAFVVSYPDQVEALVNQLRGAGGASEGQTGPEKPGAAGKAPEQASKAQGPGKQPGEGGEISTTPVKPPPVTPLPPKPVEGPEKSSPAALARLEKARSLYSATDFGNALSELGAIDPRDLSIADRGVVEEIRDRCESFREITADIRPLELADADGMVVVHLKNGNKVEGRLLRNQGGAVTIQKNHGIKGLFRGDEIDHVENLSRDKVMKRRIEEFRKMAGDPDSLPPERIFELVEHCIREGLKSEVVGLLEAGERRDRLFRAFVYNEKAKRLYKLYLWYRGKKKESYAEKTLQEIKRSFPKSPFTAKALEDQAAPAEVALPPKPGPKPGPGPRNPPPVKPPEPRAPDPAPDPWDEGDEEPEPAVEAPPVPKGSTLLAEAEKWLVTARRHEENAMPGKPGANEENKKAIAAYEKAIALYEDAQVKHPEKAEQIEELINEMQSSLFWCKKRQTLD